MLCGSPRMAKRGARSSTMRRSCSPSSPVMSAWIGALKPSAAGFSGTSATMPSVTRMRAGDLLGRHVVDELGQLGEERGAVAVGADRRHAPRAPRSRRAPAAAPSAPRPPPRSAPVRLPRRWLALSSTTSATTPGSPSRSSRCSTGLVSASTSSAEASARSAAPRTRCQASTTSTTSEQRRRALRSAARAGPDRRRWRSASSSCAHWPSRSSSAGTCTWSAL